jgi:hypothetical protein
MAGKLAAAAGITGGGLLLHFLRAISHRTYLNALSLDAGLFPRTTDWTMITGYYMAMDRFTAMFSLFVANAWIALVGMFSIALYSTESHIAIFDVDKQRAHAMERAGTELLGEVLPAKDKSKDVQSRP